MNLSDFKKDDVFKNVFTLFFILLLHVVLLVCIGAGILLFKGIYQFLPWIIGGIMLLLAGIGWIIYKKLKSDSARTRNFFDLPEFRDRQVEVKLLGGVVSVNLGGKQQDTAVKQLPADHESSGYPDGISYSDKESQIIELTDLYQKNLITKDDFETAKQNILQG